MEFLLVAHYNGNQHLLKQVAITNFLNFEKMAFLVQSAEIRVRAACKIYLHYRQQQQQQNQK